MSATTTPRAVRVALVGRTGAGKTALGRLLCHSRPDLFAPSDSAASQTPGQVGEQAYPELRLVLRILDTMGLDDTQHPPDVVRRKITQGIASLAGGVDFFFLCMKAERFTEPTYVAYKYMLEGVLGEGCLGNVWLVVTASGADLSRDRAAQQAWVRQSRTNRHFDEMVGRLGADRIVFVENPPQLASTAADARSAREEEFNAQRRDEARAALLRVITANAPTRYTIAELERAQEAYDLQCRELEARAADEARRVREEQVRAATEQERTQLEQKLREIDERLQRQLEEVRATQRQAVQQAAVTYVQHKTRALDVVMEGLKVVGMVVGAGKCVLQ